MTPYWYPYDTVCDRTGCRAAVRDAVEAIQQDRHRHKDLIHNIARRCDERTQPASVGRRGDAIAKMDVVDDSDHFVVQIAKERVE